jgi:glycosidase
VPRFYNPDVVGHHRGQTLNFDDVVNRLSSDHQRFSNSRCDIADIVAASDKFAIRFGPAVVLRFALRRHGRDRNR